MRAVGRPKKKDPNRKLISIDDAVKITDEYYSQFKKKGYSKGHIYNLLSEGKLSKEKTPKGDVLLDEREVREKLCG